MLKKVFLTLAAAAFMATSVSAGDIDPNDEFNLGGDSIVVVEDHLPYVLSIGPKVGVNYSIAGDPDGMDLGMSGNVGFNAGLAFNLRFGRPAGGAFGTERFGVQVEALYSNISLKNDVDDIKLSCFEIPVMLQWYFHPDFAVEVGPTFLGTLSASPDGLDYKGTVYPIGDIKAYDVMLSAGLNCKLKNGLTASLRYNLGNSELAGNFNTKVSTFSLGIGWLFSVIK